MVIISLASTAYLVNSGIFKILKLPELEFSNHIFTSGAYIADEHECNSYTVSYSTQVEGRQNPMGEQQLWSKY